VYCRSVVNKKRENYIHYIYSIKEGFLYINLKITLLHYDKTQKTCFKPSKPTFVVVSDVVADSKTLTTFLIYLLHLGFFIQIEYLCIKKVYDLLLSDLVNDILFLRNNLVLKSDNRVQGFFFYKYDIYF